MIKIILICVGVIFLVSLITYIGGTIYLKIQEKKLQELLKDSEIGRNRI